LAHIGIAALLGVDIRTHDVKFVPLRSR